MTAGLIVIDAQESFRHRPYFSTRDFPEYIAAQNRLILAARQRELPIVRILHVEREGAFSLDSGYVKPLPELTPFEPTAIFHKSRHSALVGSGLDVWLTENGIRKLIVSGIRTEQCCETTTRHASDLGYAVNYVLDATLTFDMKYLDGTTLPAADIKQRTAAVLADRFANIVSVEEAFENV